MEKLNLTQEWDKVFPKSDKVDHKKVTFHNRYGITLAADMYTPKGAEGKLPAIQAAISAEVKKITQPSGAATPRNSDTHKRIAVPKALCVLWEHPRPRPKSGKVCRSDTRPGDIREHAARIEGSDSAPIRNTPCFGV